MTRRSIFSVITGFIAGLFGTARAWSSNNPYLTEKYKTATEALMMEPIKKAKDIKTYYLSYFVPDKNNGHYELVPFSTENKEIIRVMEQRLGMATVVGRSFDSWVPRILSQQDLDSNAFVDDPRLAWWKRWAPEPAYEYKRLGIKVSTPLKETIEYIKKYGKYFSGNS